MSPQPNADFMDVLLSSANVVSLRAMCGMAGAVVLILAMPPKRPKGGIDFSTALHRVFLGGCLPVFMGPWALNFLKMRFSYLLLDEYPELIFFILGSLSYFLLRWLAVWLDRNKDRSITDIKFGRRWNDPPADPEQSASNPPSLLKPHEHNKAD